MSLSILKTLFEFDDQFGNNDLLSGKGSVSSSLNNTHYFNTGQNADSGVTRPSPFGPQTNTTSTTTSTSSPASGTSNNNAGVGPVPRSGVNNMLKYGGANPNSQEISKPSTGSANSPINNPSAYTSGAGVVGGAAVGQTQPGWFSQKWKQFTDFMSQKSPRPVGMYPGGTPPSSTPATPSVGPSQAQAATPPPTPQQTPQPTSQPTQPATQQPASSGAARGNDISKFLPSTPNPPQNAGGYQYGVRPDAVNFRKDGSLSPYALKMGASDPNKYHTINQYIKNNASQFVGNKAYDQNMVNKILNRK